MKRKRHTPEEIIKKLREASTLLAGGQSVEAVCKRLEVSPPTYHRWRQEYGGAKEETVKRPEALEKENTQEDNRTDHLTRKRPAGTGAPALGAPHFRELLTALTAQDAVPLRPARHEPRVSSSEDHPHILC